LYDGGERVTTKGKTAKRRGHIRGTGGVREGFPVGRGRLWFVRGLKVFLRKEGAGGKKKGDLGDPEGVGFPCDHMFKWTGGGLPEDVLSGSDFNCGPDRRR